MDNEKNNNHEKTAKNKAITIRIEQKVLEQYNNTLEKIYRKENHRKQSATINNMLKQFNKQDTDKLREYIEKDIPIINLSKEQIIEYQAQLQEKNDAIKEKEKIIATLETSQSTLESSINEKYDNEINILKHEIESLKGIISEKDKIIKDKDNAIDKQQKTIDTLDTQLTQSNKDVRTARNDYKHQTENLNKLQHEFNDVQNENKDYKVTFAEIKKMSMIERIIGKYPKQFLELSDGN